jgi:hypothetical protein
MRYALLHVLASTVLKNWGFYIDNIRKVSVQVLEIYNLPKTCGALGLVLKPPSTLTSDLIKLFNYALKVEKRLSPEPIKFSGDSWKP